MNTKLKDELAQQVGMTKVEDNADGEPQYIGTKKQWEKFDELLDKNI